jgi:hypothetical protein
MTTTINASNSGSGGLVQTADASGVLALQTAGTTAVTISAAQVVTFANPPTGVFPAGTALLFQQTAAPTGWTKVTTYNDYALRVVNGSTSTGGSVAFSTAFASQAVSGSVGTSGATTLTTGQIPNHYHQVFTTGFAGTLGIQVKSGSSDGNQYAYTDVADLPQYTTAAGSNSGTFANNDNGGGGSHTHSGGTFTGTAINLAVQYVDVIIATKN